MSAALDNLQYYPKVYYVHCFAALLKVTIQCSASLVFRFASLACVHVY